jgi:hypothetical protein
METDVARAGDCCLPYSLLKCVTFMQTDVTRTGDSCQPKMLLKLVTCMETDVTHGGDCSHSPTDYGSVSHAWKPILSAQVTAVNTRSCGSVSHA